MEAENQQVKEIIQPLLDAENGLVKVRRWTFMVLGPKAMWTFVSVTAVLVII